MARSECPCGCDRKLRRGDANVAKGALRVAAALPVAMRMADVFKARSHPDARQLRRFADTGCEIVFIELAAAHGDADARRAVKPVRQIAAWIESATQVGASLLVLDPSWGDWWFEAGCPLAAVVPSLATGAWTVTLCPLPEAPPPPVPVDTGVATT